LYGLKQASHAWFDKFHYTLLAFHFTRSQFDSSMFLLKTSTGIVLLLVYIDGIVITSFDTTLIKQLQQHLKAYFHMKDFKSLAVLSWS